MSKSVVGFSANAWTKSAEFWCGVRSALGLFRVQISRLGGFGIARGDDDRNGVRDPVEKCCWALVGKSVYQFFIFGRRYSGAY